MYIYINIYIVIYIYYKNILQKERKKEHTENCILDIELKFSTTLRWRD